MAMHFVFRKLSLGKGSKKLETVLKLVCIY